MPYAGSCPGGFGLVAVPGLEPASFEAEIDRPFLDTLRMPEKPPSVAIYARVSTRARQDTENQLRELRAFCEKQGWPIAGE